MTTDSCAVDSLKIHFHYIRSAIHEICLHHDYDPDEFKPPYLMRPQPLASGATILSPVYTTSLLACAESAHASLDTFLAMDTNMHRSIPVIVYTRSFYAMVLLSKLAVSAQAQNSSIGNMIDFESLRLIDYLYKMMAALKTVAGVENFNVPATFYVIVTKLSAWYSRQSRTGREAGKMDDILEPMKYMKTAEGVLEVEASNASNTNGTPEILVRPAASSDVSQKETPASTGEVPMHDYHNPAGFPQSTQPGFQHSFVQEMSGTLPWVQQDFQHWNFGEGQDFAAFDPVFNMTNFENSAMLAFATDEQNGPDPYHMPT